MDHLNTTFVYEHNLTHVYTYTSKITFCIQKGFQNQTNLGFQRVETAIGN